MRTPPNRRVIYRTLAALVLFALATPTVTSAAVQGRRGRSGPPLIRADAGNISFEINNQTQPGLKNAQGEEIITAASAPVEAIQAAMDSWSKLPDSRLNFAALQPTDFAGLLRDGRSVITFADTPATRSAAGGAIAITFLFSNSEGTLTDTDIIFNPTLPFSSTLAAGTFDIEATMAHELGHAIGLDHSPVIGSTMFASASRGSNRGADLSGDELAFARSIYPLASATASGTITGTVQTAQGTTPPAALVIAIEPTQNRAFGGVTDTGGVYTIRGLPAGSYRVLAEPVNSPVDPGEIAVLGGSIAQPFPTVTAGGFVSPTTIAISPGITATVDFIVDPTMTPTLNIEGGGAAPASIRVLGLTVAEVEQGSDFDVELFGEGLDSVPLEIVSISIWGTGIMPLPGTMSRSSVRLTDGRSFSGMLFRVRVSPTAPLGLATLVLANAGESAAYSGGIMIRPARLTPSFSGSSVLNAASFLTGPLVPGGIHSVFGRDFGPSEGAVTGLNPVNGQLETMVSRVSIEVDGVAAPLFYADSQQINFQIPYEVEGQAAIVVRHNGRANVPETVATIDAQPEFFQIPGSNRAVAVNQDGSLNDPSNPAAPTEFVTLFATGQGAVVPPIATGRPAPTDGNLHLTSGIVECTVGGMATEVVFAGLAPGFVGLLQLNIKIPEDAVAGENVPITLTVASRVSLSTSTISLQ